MLILIITGQQRAACERKHQMDMSHTTAFYASFFPPREGETELEYLETALSKLNPEDPHDAFAIEALQRRLARLAPES
jgi:hypothetical protein